MKGTFVSYDESTGRVTIKADTQVDSTSDAISSYLVQLDPNLSAILPVPDKENYYFIVPEEKKHQMSIKPGVKVDFDLVEEGSKEVKSMRF